MGQLSFKERFDVQIGEIMKPLFTVIFCFGCLNQFVDGSVVTQKLENFEKCDMNRINDCCAPVDLIDKNDCCEQVLKYTIETMKKFVKNNDVKKTLKELFKAAATNIKNMMQVCVSGGADWKKAGKLKDMLRSETALGIVPELDPKAMMFSGFVLAVGVWMGQVARPRIPGIAEE